MIFSSPLARKAVMSLAVFGIAVIPTMASAEPAKVPEPHVPGTEADILVLLEDNCFGCHKSSRKRGDLDLELMLKQRPLVKNLEGWQSVLLRLQNREMPPQEKKRRPSDAEYDQLIKWLDPQINQFDYSAVSDPGHEGARRLTNEEYDNTIQDLFGISLRPSLKFPQDLSGTSGFSNSANTLFLEPVQMDKYILAAEEVVVAALPAVPSSPEQERARELIFVAQPSKSLSEEAAAQEVLAHFMPRAYRRAVTDTEVTEILGYYTVLRDRGQSHEEALKTVLQVVLISPNFLFKIEAVESREEAYRIASSDFATRLSYFLWGSMPDEELTKLAANGRLFEDKVLAKQVGRMLKDPRSKTLGTSFAAQWLGFDALGTRLRLDPIDNPWCTDSLMDSMRAETSMFINELIQKNRPMQELLTADYTYLNEELANHYRLSNEYKLSGPEMKRVKLKDPNRGGIIGQGSLMAITSQPGRTSPVMRGFWVLDTVLGTPPPPPPPSVDGEFDEDIRRNRRLSPREKLALHRANPTCAACHDEMDPLGVSLENFDYFGRWRTKSRRTEIDASGTLPTGTEFVGPAGLKKVILAEKFDDLSRQVTKKMLSYALGRQLEWYDEPTIREIIVSLEKNDHKFQTLITEIVRSYPFQYKQERVEEIEEG
jgi:hypothetical protein